MGARTILVLELEYVPTGLDPTGQITGSDMIF